MVAQLVDGVSINNGAENDFQWEVHMCSTDPMPIDPIPTIMPTIRPSPRGLVRQVLIVVDANKDPKKALMAALKMHPLKVTCTGP